MKALRSWLALRCLALAARLTVWGDVYDQVQVAAQTERHFRRGGVVSDRARWAADNLRPLE